MDNQNKETENFNQNHVQTISTENINEPQNPFILDKTKYKELSIDLFTHTKVDGLPSAESSSVAMETLFRMMNVNYRVVQQLKPCDPSYIVVQNKIYTGCLMAADAIKVLAGINLNHFFSQKETAFVRFATICIENQTQYCLLFHRWFDQIKEWRIATSRYRGSGLFKYLFYELKCQKIIKAKLENMGLKNINTENVLCLLIRDLHTMSMLLGNNVYIMGNHPCSLDCVVFGIVSHILYCSVQTKLKQILLKNFDNLRNHCDRIRDKFWPDWNDIVGKLRVCVTPRYFMSFKRSRARPNIENEAACDKCLQKHSLILTEDPKTEEQKGINKKNTCQKRGHSEYGKLTEEIIEENKKTVINECES